MTSVGEIYYEGKEYETDLKGKKPGVLSEETRAALGMTEDGPPPWLINMQRYGPPPSYPNLKIPGLSAPIPPGAQFGYHPGGWGKPPVDEYGNPIYGDVFGVRASADDGSTPYDVVLERRKRWGALEELSESESEDEEEEEEEESDAGEEELGEEEMAAGIATGATGVETPEAPMDLRKRSAAPDAPPQLYRVLDAREANVADGNIMGSSHVYVVPGAGGDVAGAVPGETRAKRTAAGATEIALNRRTWRRAWTTRRRRGTRRRWRRGGRLRRRRISRTWLQRTPGRPNERRRRRRRSRTRRSSSSRRGGSEGEREERGARLRAAACDERPRLLRSTREGGDLLGAGGISPRGKACSDRSTFGISCGCAPVRGIHPRALTIRDSSSPPPVDS